MTIYVEPPEVVPGQVMSATNWKDWVVDVAKAMWVYTTAGDMEYALSANQKARLSIGANQSLLISNGSAPVWKAKGTANQVLGMNSAGTLLEWKSNVGAPKGARVFSASMSLNDSTLTEVSFTGESIDEAGQWDISQPTRVTIPETGWYLVGAYVSYENNPNGRRMTNITINHTTAVVATDYRMPVNGGVTNVSLGNPYYFTAGTYIELQVYQTSGVTLTVTTPVLLIVKL